MKTNVQDNKGVKLRVKLLAGDIGKGPLFTLQKDGNAEKRGVLGAKTNKVVESDAVDLVFEIVRNEEVFGEIPVKVSN